MGFSEKELSQLQENTSRSRQKQAANESKETQEKKTSDLSCVSPSGCNALKTASSENADKQVEPNTASNQPNSPKAKRSNHKSSHRVADYVESATEPQSTPSNGLDSARGQLSSFFLDHLERTGQLPEGSSFHQTSDYKGTVIWKGYEYSLEVKIK